MTTGDLLGLLFSYGFAFSLLLIVEAIRRWRNYSPDFTRKLIHIGAGMGIWGILLLFDHWWIAIIPIGTFIILNALFLRFHTFSAMDPKEGATAGTVYFALSCTLLLTFFHQNWEHGFPRGYEYYAMAGIMAMTWGDALSAIIGKRFGKHSYSLSENKRNPVLNDEAAKERLPSADVSDAVSSLATTAIEVKGTSQLIESEDASTLQEPQAEPTSRLAQTLQPIPTKVMKRPDETQPEQARTIEGSIAGFIFTFGAVAITLYILSPLSFPLILVGALVAAIVGTLLEAISPQGTDNLSVPIGVAIVLLMLGL